LEESTVNVLVVDDYEPFRRFACSTLAKMQNLKVIGEASDGLEAVRKTEELKPDLIVLDIGLPTLNGIEVARQVRNLRPQCKILFLSQESSAAVAQEAFSLGAMGYVVKAYAGRELSAAVEAVCQGRLFLSEGLSGHDPTDVSLAHGPGPPRPPGSPTRIRGRLRVSGKGETYTGSCRAGRPVEDGHEFTIL
jgi:DNA-binding NarL/FixJ family response regulator